MRAWLKERAFQLTRERCPWCGAAPLRATAEMVVFTNGGYRFPTVDLTYCLMCEQLLGAELAGAEEPCACGSHLERDIAESDTLPLRNPHRLTDIVFSSCAACGQVQEARIHF